MDVKILRFLELSSEFCKEPEDYKEEFLELKNNLKQYLKAKIKLTK